MSRMSLMSRPGKALDDAWRAGPVALDVDERSGDAPALVADRHGARLVHHEGERRLVDRLHPAIDEHLVDRVERLLRLEHRRRVLEQADPGAAVEVVAALPHVDGALEVGVPGDDEVD